MASVNDQQGYTLQKESKKIFDLLVDDERLHVPSDVKAIASSVKFIGHETQPFFPVPYKCAEVHASLAGLVGLFANTIGKLRYGIEQDVLVDVDHAMMGGLAALFFRYDGQWLSGSNVQNAAAERWDHGQTREAYRQLGTNIYQTKDGRWYCLHGSMNPTPLLSMLGLPQHDEKNRSFTEIIKMYMEIVKGFESETLDDWSNNVYRIPGTICYEKDEFEALPHGKAIQNEPIYNIVKEEYYNQPPVPWPKTDSDDPRPLTGIKILDLSRAIAAPTISRVCAALGATVMRISSETNTELPLTLIDGCTGKISVDVNLKTFEGRKTLIELIKAADVFVDGYRPSVLEHLGFGRDAVLGLNAKRERGIIYVQENCYGWKGPWIHRPGWAQIADTVCGIGLGIGRFHGHDEAHIFPGPNADYLTGHAGVVGTLHALLQRNKHGGSYIVQCSLLVSDLHLLSYGTYTKEQEERLKKRNPEIIGHMRHYHEIVAHAKSRQCNVGFVADRPFNACIKKEFFQTIDGSPWGIGPVEVVKIPLKLTKTRTDFPIGAAPPGYHLPKWTVEKNPNFRPLPAVVHSKRS